MTTSFLITLREGLEAALIISIILAYLGRTGHRHRFRNVWLGTGAAVVVSLAAGAGLFWAFGELSGRAEQLFEGSAMLLAVLVLTYMVLWMKRQAANIKAHLEAQVESALATRTALALAFIAFLVVVREGIETVLFLFSASRAATPFSVTAGGLAGLGAALAIGYAGYRGSRWLNLRAFFNVTGVLLILFAGGLLAYGIHEFQEAGVFPVIIEHVWDLNPVLSENEGAGRFLKALFGYNANPSLLEVVCYGGYLAASFWNFFGRGQFARREMA